MSEFSTFIVNLKKVFFYLKRHASWVLLGRFYLMIIGVLISVILTRMMTKSEYGEYQYFLVVLSIFSFISLPNATNVLIRYYGKGYAWSYMGLFFLRLKFSLLAVFLFLGMAIYAFLANDIYTALVFLIFSICFPLFYSCDLFEYLLQSEMNFKKLNIYYIIRSSARFLVVILTYWIMGNILFSIIGYILTTTLVNSWLFYKTKSDYAIKYKNINKMVHKKMNTMAVNLSLIGVFSLVSSQIDKILIAEFISIEALANYSIGMLIGMSINTIFKSVISIFDVKFVKNKIGLIYYLFLFFLGSIVGWALTYLVSHVIVILYGDAYSSSIIYASIILSSMGIYLVAILSENHFLLYFDKNEKIAYSSSIFTSLVVLLLISTIIMYPLEDEIKLILFALIYPVKLILVVFTHLFFEKYNTPTN